MPRCASALYRSEHLPSARRGQLRALSWLNLALCQVIRNLLCGQVDSGRGQRFTGCSAGWRLLLSHCDSHGCARRGDPNSETPSKPGWERLTVNEAMGLLLEEGAFGSSPELASHIGAGTDSVHLLQRRELSLKQRRPSISEQCKVRLPVRACMHRSLPTLFRDRTSCAH